MRYKVDVGDLQLGMYVADLDRPWIGTPFMFQGFLIEAKEELEQLQAICKFVVVDEAQSKIPVGSVGKPEDAGAASTKEGVSDSLKPVTRKSSSSGSTHAGVQENIELLFAEAKQGSGINIKESQAIVARLVQQSVNQNLMMQMANLRNRQDREAGHSLNSAILAIAFGRHLGHSEERLRLLGLGAILHDIGKTRVSDVILKKPGKLTSDEYEAIKRHPTEGYEMLKSAGDVPEEVLDMVRYHHERHDGSGYPARLQADAISISVGIVAIVDAYETLTTNNPYQPALTPIQALQRLRTTGSEGFGKELLQDFMRFMGLYPVGSVVKLNSGEIAVVYSVDPKIRMRPLLMVVRDENGREIRPTKLINLALLSENKLSIIDIVDPSKYSIDTTMLFEKQLSQL